MIRTIQVVHSAILIFVVSAGFWPWPAIWPVHMVFVPLMFLHWKTNQNRCVLTQIEAKFKGHHEVSESAFIKGLWTRMAGQVPSDASLQRMINSILVLAFSVSAIHWWIARR